MKKPVVFSLFRDQSIFMTTIMALMSFLAILALGLAMAIGNGVLRWNRQWDTFITIQVTNTDNTNNVKNMLQKHSDIIANMHELTTAEMTRLMSPWLSGGNSVLQKYLPNMFEIKLKSKSDIDTIKKSIGTNARVLTHSDALSPSISAGWKMIFILSLVLGLIIGTIGICISFIARNTAILHKRELEILNQVGANDSFITKQMRIIVMKICTIACTIGFLIGAPVLMLIIGIAHSARVGLMATIGLSGTCWGILVLTPWVIILFATVVARRTTLNILNNSK